MNRLGEVGAKTGMMEFPYVYTFKRAVLFGQCGSPLYRQRCRVLRRGAKNSVLVEFADGTWHVVSRHALRSAELPR
jgi:hypothetical protein